FLDSFGLRFFQRSWNHQPRALIQILGLIVVELVRRNDLSRQAGEWVVVPQDGALNLTRVETLLDDDLAVVLSCEIHSRIQRRCVLHFADAYGRTRVRRLDKAGIAQLLLDGAPNRLLLRTPVMV